MTMAIAMRIVARFFATEGTQGPLSGGYHMTFVFKPLTKPVVYRNSVGNTAKKMTAHSRATAPPPPLISRVVGDSRMVVASMIMVSSQSTTPQIGKFCFLCDIPVLLFEAKCESPACIMKEDFYSEVTSQCKEM